MHGLQSITNNRSIYSWKIDSRVVNLFIYLFYFYFIYLFVFITHNYARAFLPSIA